jgi:hypothetical protein
LEELKRLRGVHELNLDAAGEGNHGLDREGNTTFGSAVALVYKPWVNLTRCARIILDIPASLTS